MNLAVEISTQTSDGRIWSTSPRNQIVHNPMQIDESIKLGQAPNVTKEIINTLPVSLPWPILRISVKSSYQDESYPLSRPFDLKYPASKVFALYQTKQKPHRTTDELQRRVGYVEYYTALLPNHRSFSMFGTTCASPAIISASEIIINIGLETSEMNEVFQSHVQQLDQLLELMRPKREGVIHALPRRSP